MREYETEQRKCLRSFFIRHLDRHFTAEELANNIDGISVSTVYRNINQMVEEGIIRRVQKNGQRKFLYQYIGKNECSEHLHLKCNGCGRILHMNNKSAISVLDAVKSNFSFEVDKTATILYDGRYILLCDG